jgi:hypothetical protein
MAAMMASSATTGHTLPRRGGDAAGGTSGGGVFAAAFPGVLEWEWGLRFKMLSLRFFAFPAANRKFPP